MKKNGINNMGFTLIELLAVIVVLGVVVSVSIFVSISLINNKDDKITLINSEAEYKSVLAYATEFKDDNDYQSYNYGGKSFRYVCVKIKDLVDKGYLDKDKVRDVNKEIIVIRNNDMSYVPYETYGSDINTNFCNVESITGIDIEVETEPNIYGDGNWYNTNVKGNVLVTSNRANSVTEFRYGIGNNLNNKGIIRDGKKGFDINNEGKNIRFNVSVGDGGDGKTAHKNFNIDKTAPVININGISSFTYTSGSITKFKLTYKEDLSGLYKIYISDSSSKPSGDMFKSINIDNYGYVRPVGFSINKATTYYVWVMDKAGNISAKSKSFKFDNEKPRLVYEWDYTNGQCGSSYPMWRIKDRDIKLTFSDNVAVKSYKITNTSTGSVVKSEDFGTNGVKTTTRTVNLKKGSYKIEVTDVNGLSYYTTVSPSYLDDEGPTLDYNYSTFDFDCTDYGIGYSFDVGWIESHYMDTVSDEDAYYKITTSRSTPTSGWKRFSYQYNNLEFGEVYYFHLKFIDDCGNVSTYRYASFSCDGGGDSGGGSDYDDDCHKVCLMKDNSVNWHFSTGYSNAQTMMHAVNSIIAGELSFNVSYDNIAGTWYKGGGKLYTWYNNNCRGTTCGTTDLEVNRPRYSAYKLNGYNSCTNHDSSYVSGFCSDNFCYCCPIGTGFYAGDCYRYYSER